MPIGELEALRAENKRLIELLEIHGVDWKISDKTEVESELVHLIEAESSALGTAERIAIFRKLFRGRTDIYPIRWESKTTGKSGYAPAE